MKFKWADYTPEQSDLVNSWLDSDAIHYTGMADGWDCDYNYWRNVPYIVPGKNYWSKIVSDSNGSFALLELSKDNGKLIIMQFLISPKMRNKGFGSSVLHELINNGKIIVGEEILEASAVIFSDNVPCEKVFVSSGFFRGCSCDDNNDAWNYNYEKAI